MSSSAVAFVLNRSCMTRWQGTKKQYAVSSQRRLKSTRFPLRGCGINWRGRLQVDVPWWQVAFPYTKRMENLRHNPPNIWGRSDSGAMMLGFSSFFMTKQLPLWWSNIYQLNKLNPFTATTWHIFFHHFRAKPGYKSRYSMIEKEVSDSWMPFKSRSCTTSARPEATAINEAVGTSSPPFASEITKPEVHQSLTGHLFLKIFLVISQNDQQKWPSNDQVDLSATVASLAGTAHFYGSKGDAFIDCLNSDGSCGQTLRVLN